jgi:alpha-tubulin suppressor-like RCC1 family protein
LGHGDETGENIPKEIVDLKDKKIFLISAGDANSAAITQRNELYIWGVGLNGRLGNGRTSNVLRPSLVEDLKDSKVEDISLGSTHTLCLLRNGKGLCWGSSSKGKMGLEATLDRNFL